MTWDLAAAKRYIAKRLAAGELTTRDIAQLVAHYQAGHGLKVDGMPGPATMDRLTGFLDSDLTPVEGVPVGMSRAARRLERARSVVGQGRYHLGSGGKNPQAPHPFDSDGTCDCSGLVCWVLELPRKDPATGVWRNTDQLEADARGQVRGDIGDGVPWEDAQPGDVIVYGAGPKIGHTGIVSAANADGPTAVIHCRSGAAPACVETGPSLFKARGAVILRPR